MDGLWFRIASTLVGASVAVISAVLGFSEFLPIEAKIGLVAANAGLAYVMNALPSWVGAPHAARALRSRRID